jgi:hypothetical protein
MLFRSGTRSVVRGVEAVVYVVTGVLAGQRKREKGGDVVLVGTCDNV